ncbi:hypothetical protein Trydic_g5683 [Trypoxylus dichotomus]
MGARDVITSNIHLSEFISCHPEAFPITVKRKIPWLPLEICSSSSDNLALSSSICFVFAEDLCPRTPTGIPGQEDNETELNEWIDGDDDLLPLHSDDSVSNHETVIDKPKVKHEEARAEEKVTIVKWPPHSPEPVCYRPVNPSRRRMEHDIRRD